MTNFQKHDRETVLLHGGQIPDPTTGSRAVPIYQTTSYVFNDTTHAQNLFGLKEAGNIYSRIGNPTVAAFEQRVAELEDGVQAVATSSGMAAITFAILNVASAGDEIITDSNLYGGTYNLFANTLPRYGIHVKFVDGTNPNEVEAAITDKTKAIFGETITNPSLHIFDVEKIAAIAHAHHIPLIIDNTFAPYITKPLAWGADIVVHSATKWIGGHGTTIGGVVVDGGRFNWDHEKFPGFTVPDESYHGLRFVDVGPAAFATKLRVQLLRDIGACLSPYNAFLLLQGLETLHLRLPQHVQNAQKVAAYLNSHPAIEWVSYPGLESHPSYHLAKKYFSHGAGSIITFGIKGGLEAGRTLIDNIELWSHVANVGDAKSLIIHPASTTHQQLSTEELAASGTTEEMVRLSIGLESINDLLKTLDTAISKATGNAETIGSDEDDAIEWLLHSPFAREDGNVRKKTIVVYGLGQANNSSKEKVKQLEKLGFDLVEVGKTFHSETLPQYEELSAIPTIVDAIWFIQPELPATVLQQFINKDGKILWIEHPDANLTVLENVKAVGIPIITGKNPYELAVSLRGNQKSLVTV
ncbi:O-acetylhomoserine aminocarboxypropyltransferase/cysteine synthase family protein [Cerasibacillus sp. JNUCC 74]